MLYLIISLYFFNHTFYRTSINEVNISFKDYDQLDDTIRNYANDYELELIERGGEREVIAGEDIEFHYNEESGMLKLCKMQNPIRWIGALFVEQKYYLDNLFLYNENLLEDRINSLNCFKTDIVEPQNVSFRYSNFSYHVIEAIYGNKVKRQQLYKEVNSILFKGKKSLNLDQLDCYENPQYTSKSTKTQQTIKLLNKYVSSKITYLFGKDKEMVDGDTINKWLSVDRDLGIVIDEKLVKEYLKKIAKKYDTVGKKRKFKTSVNKTIELKEGFYGWRMSCVAETIALIDDIKMGKTIEKEPIYSQEARTRGENDIGNTYLEINLTRQYLWFYKNGKLIAHGNVVTGNPNRGNATKPGVYMLNYKEAGSTLRGHNYEAEVKYWMPFNGDTGLHDASWRYSFGGNIYKRNGSHGCVNAPLYLAKKVYENIEEGTPVICYVESK